MNLSAVFGPYMYLNYQSRTPGSKVAPSIVSPDPVDADWKAARLCAAKSPPLSALSAVAASG